MFTDENGEMPKWLSTSLKIVAGVAVIAACVVGAVLSGGSAVLVGAAIGATVSGISAGISTAISGGDIHDFANSFLMSTVTGAISGAVGASSIGVGGQMLANASLNIVNYVGTQQLSGKDTTLNGIVFNGAVGIFSVAVGSFFGGNKTSGSALLPKGILEANKNIDYLEIKELLIAAVCGVAGGFYDKHVSPFDASKRIFFA